MDSDAFAAYVEHLLCPTLTQGQIVILDNLSVHKRADIRQQIEAAGCQLLFLPAYSPDFNPIEQAFSKLKAWLRQAEARTQDALEAAIAAALNTITRSDAAWLVPSLSVRSRPTNPMKNALDQCPEEGVYRCATHRSHLW